MNSKLTLLSTAGVTCFSLLCATVLSLHNKAADDGSIIVDGREQFLSVNQDLMPQAVQTIEKNQEQNLLKALLSGGDISNADANICIWASSDNQSFQTVLEDSSINLNLHHDKENDETILAASMVENGDETLSISVNSLGDNAGIYIPQIDQNYYTMNKSQLYYGLEAVTGFDVSVLDQTDAAFMSDQESEGEGQEGSDTTEFTGILETVLTAVTNDNVQVVTGDNIWLSHLGENVTGNTYSCTPGAKDFEKMLNNLADYMDNHENARTYIHNIFGELSKSGSDLEYIESVLINEDNALRDNSKAIADKLSNSNLNWSVNCDEDGNGRYLSLSFTIKDISVVIACEKSLDEALYISASFDDSYISLKKCPDTAHKDEVSMLGLSYGEVMLQVGDETNGSELTITTSKVGDLLTDETVIQFYGGANMGNVELHIESSSSDTASVPEVEDEYMKDITAADDEEIVNLFKTYRGGLSSILLCSKLMNSVL